MFKKMIIFSVLMGAPLWAGVDFEEYRKQNLKAMVNSMSNLVSEVAKEGRSVDEIKKFESVIADANALLPAMRKSDVEAFLKRYKELCGRDADSEVCALRGAFANLLTISKATYIQELKQRRKALRVEHAQIGELIKHLS